MRLLVLGVLIAGCTSGVVQRTVRAPHAAAPLWSGAPMQGPLELSGGVSSVLDVRAPRLHDTSAGVEVPSVQWRGELRIR